MFLVYILTVIFSGYGCFFILFRKRPIHPVLELHAIAIVLGCVINTLIYYNALLLNIRLHPVIFIFGSFALFVYALTKHRPKSIDTLISPNKKVSIAVFALLLLFTAFISYKMKFYSWDAFAIWGLKAKQLYFTGIVGNAEFTEPALAYSHLTYPKFWPALMSQIYSFTGFHEGYAKLVLSLFFMSFALLFFHLYQSINKLFLFAVLFCPAILIQFSSAYADAIYACLYAISLYSVFQYVKTKETAYFILFTVFAAASLLTKNEGFFPCIAGLVILAYAFIKEREKMKRSVLAYGLITVFAVLPYFIWKSGLRAYDENYIHHLNLETISENSERILIIAKSFFSYMFGQIQFQAPFYTLPEWGLVWILAVAFSIYLFLSQRTVTMVLCISIFGAQLMLYGLIYLISPWEVTALIQSSIDRLLLHLLIPILFLIAEYPVKEIEVEITVSEHDEISEDGFVEPL